MHSQPATEPVRNRPSSTILVREARPADLQRPDLTDGYFASALKGLGRDLEGTVLETTLRRAQGASGWLQLWADAGDQGCGALLVEPKAWDSEMLSVPTSNLVLVAAGARKEVRKEIAGHLLRAYLAAPSPMRQYVVARIPSEDVALLHALEEHGFHSIVPMVTLARHHPLPVSVDLAPGIELSPVRTGEAEAVGAISATAFAYGRFSADPGVSTQGAENVHRTWARNCALGTQATETLVARKGGKVVGFIALKFLMAGETKVGSIELIANAPEARGIGVGRALVRAGCNWLAQTTPHVVVRTELPNTGALRLYEAEGFRILSGSVYLSLWQPSTPAAASR